MNLRKAHNVVDFEVESAVDMGDLLGAESDAWPKRQYVDQMWWKLVCCTNLRGSSSKVKLRFVRKGAHYCGRVVFSILVSRLSECYESNTGLFGLLLPFLLAHFLFSPRILLSRFPRNLPTCLSWWMSVCLLISLSTCASLSVDALQRVSKEG
jgi:hypothetical protein